MLPILLNLVGVPVSFTLELGFCLIRYKHLSNDKCLVRAVNAVLDKKKHLFCVFVLMYSKCFYV